MYICITCGHLSTEDLQKVLLETADEDLTCQDCGSSKEHLCEFNLEKKNQAIDELFKNFDI